MYDDKNMQILNEQYLRPIPKITLDNIFTPTVGRIF